MEDVGGSDALRAAAPEWSLAGDRELLTLLQKIHQKIMTRCEDTNNKLEEMVAALDMASITLQNVNNRFMALSNSQFVESRVYDDDTDVTGEVGEKKKPAPAPVTAPSPLAGLLTLERLHEPVPICEDSDSDSDSDQATSIVLKPKDQYSSRPLPYLIGSYNWKTKWHVGLMPEENESDSSASSRVESPAQYSDSESEVEGKSQLGETYRQSSSSSSERHVDKSVEAHASESAQPSQADIAAELARRLGGYVESPIPARVIEDQTHTTVPRKLYKPQEPTSATIFSDEPPPLDASKESDVDVDSDSDNDDIFAEINRKAPYSAKNKAQNAANVDIFADLRDNDDGFGEREPKGVENKVFNGKEENKKVVNKVINDKEKDFLEGSKENNAYVDKNKSQNALVNEIKARVTGFKVDNDVAAKREEDKRNKPLFDGEEDTDLFAKMPDGGGSVNSEKNTVKKPAGAISLFGNKKDAASIGAAILNRNRRKSSSDGSFDDETIKGQPTRANETSKENTSVKESKHSNVETVEANVNKDTGVRKKEVVRKDARKKEKDIFDDLFEKSAKKEKEKVGSNKQDVKATVDLFSDNIFDDIDDIFSSHVVVNKTVKNDAKKSSKSESAKSIFDDDFDDDDGGLFADIDKSAKTIKEFDNKTDKTVKKTNEKGGIFDSDDDLFSEEKIVVKKDENVKTVDAVKVAGVTKKGDSLNASIFDSDDDLFSGNKKASEVIAEKAKTLVVKDKNIPSKLKESKGLFDDSDSDDIFSNIKPPISSQMPEIVSDKTEAENDTVNKTEMVSTDDRDEVIKVKETTETKVDKNDENLSPTLPPETADVNQENDNCNMQTSTDSVKSYETDDIVSKSTQSEQKSLKSPSIFDDDDETDGLFTNSTKKEDNKVESKTNQITESQKTQDTFVSVQKTHKPKEVLNKTVDFRSPSIFDSDNEDDLFRKTPQIEKPKETSKTHELTQENNTKSIDDSNKNKTHEITTAQTPTNNQTLDNKNEDLDTNKNVEEKATLFSKTEDSNSSTKEPSIFEDIFTEPPIFEKPKEPKRSKNINALFDDDSDDESLFFRKTDAIGDEKVDDFSPAKEEKITLFHDEPPAIDIDFGLNTDNAKENKNTVEFEDEKTAKVDTKPLSSKQFDNTDGVTQSKTEPAKVIGKLKPMQFNINVNTLLPGASPKKAHKIAPQTDSIKGHDQDIPKGTDKDVITKPIDEPSTSKPKIEQAVSKLVKSASFEETPESPVLDNKVSKDRAKIQVKRRPSTRRARKEAVRKSTIDYVDGPDDGNRDSVENVNNIEDENDSNDNKVGKEQDMSTSRKANNEKEFEVKDNDFDKEIKDAELGVKENVVDFKSSTDTDIFDTMEVEQKSGTGNVFASLNDDDLFRKDNEKTPEHIIEDDNDLFKQKVYDLAKTATEKARKEAISIQNKDKTQVLNINDVDVYILKDPQVEEEKTQVKQPISDDSKEITDEQETADKNAPKEKKLADKKPSIFDDLSDDDDLFGASSKSQRYKHKNVIFSNTDDELFATATVKKEGGKGVKGSLFGDDDDDDDEALFGVKRKTSQEFSQQASSKPKATAAPTTFEDPLSLFDNEDD